MQEMTEEHKDNHAVLDFCMEMQKRLAEQRANGYWGWDKILTEQQMRDELCKAIEAGHLIDIANWLCFMHNRGIKL